jgi:hypothetical protein
MPITRTLTHPRLVVSNLRPARATSPARGSGFKWEVTKEYRKWVTGFPLERVDYLDLTLEIQGVIEGVVRGFRKAVIENQPRHYKPWTPKDSKWTA